MLKVGFIDYINAFPLNAAFRKGILNSDCELFFNMPTTLNRELRQGNLDISHVSSVEFLDGGHALLPGFGVSARTKILTVNLYTKKDPAQLSGARIGLTHQSATSVALLKVLCKHMWKVAPRFELLNEPHASYDAVLLIGDEALEKQTLPGFQTIDLAEQWIQATGLPFVFAVFAVRKEVAEKRKVEVDNFQRRLQASLNWSENNPDEILKLATERSKVPLPLIKLYYSLCYYRLGKKEMEGLALFEKLKHAT